MNPHATSTKHAAVNEFPPCAAQEFGNPRAFRCGDADWSVPAELREPCYIRFDTDDPAYHTDNFGPRVYLRHADAQFNQPGRVFCTACGWEPTPTDPKSLYVNESLLRQHLVQETLDHEGSWPIVDDQSGPSWPETYQPT
jgi:hypothetical protein